ncbi:dipeptidase [Sorangium cellulosum]|uniref:Dipeptidase n=1 Tax=Sorangium cellulosum TaxID=56 RepID=A0A4P2PZD0_SORCE|nr:dipeptidase [Sorangium cellulosum]AUX22255.1 dipeptidase [Sorangium cellulosum]
MRTSLSVALLAAAALAACVPPAAPADAPGFFAPGADEIAPWTGAAFDETGSPVAPDTPEQRAARLRRRAILVDGHSGAPSLLLRGSLDRVGPGHDATAAELAGLKATGVTGVFFPIRVDPPSGQAPSPLDGSAARRALDLIDATHRQIERHRATLVLARKARDVRRAQREGRVAVLLGIDGGHAVENSLPALRSFYRLGVRAMALTHTTTNDWADSAGGALEPGAVRHRGLSPFGEAVVREMQRLGMLVDLSHASGSTFQAVMKVAKAPVITSSSMPAAGHHRRPLDDYMLRAIAENGGLVMVNAWALFLDEAYAEQSARFLQKHGAHLAALGERSPGDAGALREELEKLEAHEGPLTPPPLSRIVDHIDHVVKIAGVDHVCVGSSFDGVDVRQGGLAGVDGSTDITLELVRRGYSDRDILKMLGGNLLRVLERAEAHADATETTLSGDGSTRQLTAADLPEPTSPPATLPPPLPPRHAPPPEVGMPSERPVLPPPRPAPQPRKPGAPEPQPMELMLSR